MAISLRWLDRTTLPVEAEGLSPKFLAGISAIDVSHLVLPVGNDEAEVGDLFEVSETGGGTPDELILEGDLVHLRNLGRGLERGRITVRGNVGSYVGAEMGGGEIEVGGCAGDWAGAEMKGGFLSIRVDAGHHLGSALPGSLLGMRDGVIFVDGSVGHNAGLRMRRGLIAVGGGAGDGCGRGLVAGTLLVFGAVGRHPGMGMKRGTLGLFQESAPEMLPSFTPTGRYQHTFVSLYLRQLNQWGFPVPARVTSTALDRYNGDLAVSGRGEILVLAGSCN